MQAIPTTRNYAQTTSSEFRDCMHSEYYGFNFVCVFNMTTNESRRQEIKSVRAEIRNNKMWLLKIFYLRPVMKIRRLANYKLTKLQAASLVSWKKRFNNDNNNDEEKETTRIHT
jgi:hypothetical protein